METGDLIPFDKIIDIKADDFKSSLLSFLIKENQAMNATYYDYKWMPDEDISRLYAPNQEHNFNMQYYSEIVKLNYEYFYDGRHQFTKKRISQSWAEKI